MDTLSSPRDGAVQSACADSSTRPGPFPTFVSFEQQVPGAALEHAVTTIREQEPNTRAWAYLAGETGLPKPKPNPELLNGPLAGIPIGVKDVITAAGMPTRCGSTASDDRPAALNGACVELLVRAGAVPVGKTITAEYAFRHPGPTRNPRNLAHTPGGSSSGSAAAVAAGMVPVALSTQTGGSIIRPAAYCGVPGFKPSFGLLSRDGMQLTSDSLDTIGWHASDMDWMIRAAHVLLPSAQGNGSLRGFDGARVAVVDYAPEASLEAEGRETLELVIQLLERAGATCVRVDARSHLDKLVQAHTAIMKYEFARNLAPVVSVGEDRLTASLLKNVEEGWNTPASLYLEMCAYQYEMRLRWDAVSGGADFILTPPAAGPAPEGHDFTGTPAFNKCWTVLGWPCLHVPVRTNSAGLPTGVQLVGPWKNDFDVLSYGAQLERLI